MLRIEPKAEYADVMERALYNCTLAGMALDGKHFFYVNPLEVNPKKSLKDPGKSHVKPVRPSWLGCACCPPNLARMITSMDDYVYTILNDTVLVNLFVDSTATLDVEGGSVEIIQSTDYPWDENVRLTIKNNSDSNIRIGVRIPGWTNDISIKADGQDILVDPDKGYQYMSISSGQEISAKLILKMEILRNYSNPLVSENVGKVAISRGPFIYCLEGVDNGEDLHCISLPESALLEYKYEPGLLNGTGVITGIGKKIITTKESEDLYLSGKPKLEDTKLKFIPYYAWANRGENEMEVWVRE